MTRPLIVATALIVVILLRPSSLSTAPPVTWIPGKVVKTVAPGSTTVTTVSFTSEINLRDVSVFVVPKLAPYVAADPSSFDEIRAGVAVTIELIVSVPIGAPFKTIGGTLHLKRNESGKRLKKNKSGKGPRTYSKPLPIRVSVEEADPVEMEPFEEYPAWNMPDAAITNLTVEPERAGPRDRITLVVTVANQGTGHLSSPTLRFRVDDKKFKRVAVGPLAPGEEAEYRVTLRAGEPGRHLYFATLEFEEGDFDRTFTNNSRTATAYVDGEHPPEPGLEFGEIDFDVLQLTPGESYSIPVTVRNPSFAQLDNIKMYYVIDGVPVVPLGSDDIDSILYANIKLAPGQQQELHIPWSDVTPGDHIITAAMDLPDTFPDVASESLKSWCAVVPDKPVLYSTPQKDKWASIGPQTLTGVPTNIKHTNFGKNGNIGRVDRIAFHPSDSKILYAGTPAGGLWKSTNGGDNWTPLGDKWPSLRVGAVAVDPKHPQVVYVATGSSSYKGGVGFFKSIDGGQTWHIFASSAVSEGASDLVIRYTTSDEVVVYAASDRGLLRYVSDKPWVTQSTPGDWVLLRAGTITDMAVSPDDDSLVYASMQKYELSAKTKKERTVFGGLYRTRNGATAVDQADAQWDLVTTGLPSISGTLDPLDKPGYVKLDIFAKDPKSMYVAVITPQGADGEIGKDLPFLGIYQSITEGDSWFLREYVYENNGFNDFIRVHPTNSQLVYFGGVHFFKRDLASEGSPVLIDEVHDDIKALEFDPSDSNRYYVLTDGGIWRCQVGENPNCLHRNNDLLVTMFYDFDVHPTDSSRMIGGTQDNGTILYTGSPGWKVIRGGDGNFALIASDDVLYSQHQGFKTTARCENGVNCGWSDWTSASSGLPDQSGGEAFIAVYPQATSPYTLASQGSQTYFTGNGGYKWKSRGPKAPHIEPPGATVKGAVTRVVVGLDFILAGTSQGQIWQTALAGTKWYLLYEHSTPVRTNSMALAPTGPTEHKVLYVTFTSGDPKRNRVYRLVRDPYEWLDWQAQDITSNYPTLNCPPLVVSGDGYSPDRAYVGTKAGVYRGLKTGSSWYWSPYNDGLPLANVTDLLVAPNKELRAATYGRGAWSIITGPEIVAPGGSDEAAFTSEQKGESNHPE